MRRIAGTLATLPRTLVFLRALAALLLACGVFVAWGPVARAGEATAPGGHRVRWDGALEPLGRRVVRLLPVVAARVEDALGFGLAGPPAEVVLVTGAERMREVARAGVPDWAAGIYVPGASRIVLRSDLATSGPLRSLETVLRHEWVHLAWARRAGPHRRRLPLWVEEGLAEEIGGGVSVDAGARLDLAAVQGRLIPFGELEAEWPQDPYRAGLAYAQARDWVRYFSREAGWPVLHSVLADLAAGKGQAEVPGRGSAFAELVFEHSGSTMSHWEAAWKSRVEEEADPWFHLLLRDVIGTLFLLLALASAVAYLFMRRRRRRQLAALPDDEPPGGDVAGPVPHG